MCFKLKLSKRVAKCLIKKDTKKGKAFRKFNTKHTLKIY